MSRRSQQPDQSLLIVIALSFVLGMLVALALYTAWRTQPALLEAGAGHAVALLLCPAFVLVAVVGPSLDSTLAVVMTVSAIVFGNAFLYAGVAAFGYFVVTTLWPTKS